MPYISFYGGSAGTPAGPGISDQWRIYITAVQLAGNWPTIKEIEMRATSGGADQCDGGTATASSYNDPPGALVYLPANAFDNATADSNIWQAANGTLPAWIQYTFASLVDVTEVSIQAWTSPTDSPKDFDIQHWDDDTSSWVTSWSVTGETGWTDDEIRVFTKP